MIYGINFYRLNKRCTQETNNTVEADNLDEVIIELKKYYVFTDFKFNKVMNTITLIVN